MSFPFSSLSFTGSSRTASAVAGLALAAVGTAIYLSPHGHGAGNAPAKIAGIGSPSSSYSAPSADPTSSPPSSTKTSRPTSSVPTRPTGRSGPTTTRTETRTRTHTETRTKVVISYVGSKRTVVHVPTKAALLQPKTKFYGLAEDGLPGSSGLFNTLANTAGKSPDLVEWFSYWDDSYSPQKVTQAWSRGALPVITWQGAPHDFSNSSMNISSYAQKNVAAGGFDKYLRGWASSIVSTGLPVVLRLNHEMNGNWYPWAAGYSRRGIANTPADYRAAWQHIWQVFQDAGANQYVIWAWTPSRTDTLHVGATSGAYAGDTGLVEDYPGDQYVDWMGLSAYQFRPTQPSSYDFIIGGTLEGNDADVGMKTVSDKPIVVAEMGSTQDIGDTDNTDVKVAWTKETLARIAADPRIVGFVLFNNDVKDVHGARMADGTYLKFETNWKFDSSPKALAAFRSGISDPVYGSGLMPADIKGTVVLQKAG